MKKNTYLVTAIILCLFAIISCEEVKDNVDSDAEKLKALETVKIEYDSITYEIGLPPGATGGQSLAVLLLGPDSSTFKDPENYSIDIALNVSADNTDPKAQDAEFDGLGVDFVMDTLLSEPINMESDGFEVKKNEVEPVTMETVINMATHRQTCLYIFRQTVDGEDLLATGTPFLSYTLSYQAGDINLPPFTQNIPTRASDETKLFLGELLNSGIFDE